MVGRVTYTCLRMSVRSGNTSGDSHLRDDCHLIGRTMKKLFSLFFALSLTLSACGTTSTQSTPPEQTETQPPFTYTSIYPLTATLLPNTPPPPTLNLPPLLTPRVTPLPTRLPADIREGLSYMLQTNGDCVFPCFWGIRPYQTRYEELYSVIDNLGGSRFETSQPEGAIHVSSYFNIEENHGIFVEFGANLQDDIVESMKIRLLNLYEDGVAVEDWSAYNLDKIQAIYGSPDKVELAFGQISNAIWFIVTLRYESISTVIIYDAAIPESKGNQFSTSDSVLFCPKEIVFGTVTLYMGNYPFNTIPSGLPILKSTGLTEQEFYKLFTENPSTCLTLNRKAFYP